ncbi:Tripartite ATP-independent periplasmic transporters, DctQ component [bacterium YEK0313]|nr:Tripartite ATP-independent periplasmic transporters, DctQ component [bacterium YEK0313]
MRKLLDGLYLGAAWLGALAVFAICAIMMTQAALRLNGTLLRGADDVTAWVCAAAAFLPLAATFKRGELVRMGIIVERFSDRTARWIELVALAICAAFGLYLAYWLCNMVYESFIFDERGQGLLPIPIWIPQTPVAIGAIVLAIAVIDELVRVASGLVPTYVQQVRDRHAAGDYSGEV